MAIDKTLARGWTFFIRTSTGPDVWTQIKGINSFSFAGSKEDTDTTDFDSQGRTEHLVAARSANMTLEGHYLIAEAASKAKFTTALGLNKDLVHQAKTAGSAGNAITVTYVVSGVSTPLSVSVVGTDITINVATDAASAPISTAAEVRTACNEEAGYTAIMDLCQFAPNTTDGTGVVAAITETALSTGADAGDRDPGQEAVETLADGIGTASIGRFRMTGPSGANKEFSASAEIEGPGGGNNDSASWQARLSVSGAIS